MQDYNYVRPSVVTENVLFVKGARHPLQEQAVASFIPNDIALAPLQASAIAVVTGPNCSGKVCIADSRLDLFLQSCSRR